MKIRDQLIMNNKKVRLLFLTLSIFSLMVRESLAVSPLNHASAPGTTISVSAGDLNDEEMMTDNDYDTSAKWRNVPTGAVLSFQMGSPINIGAVVFVLETSEQRPTRQEIKVYAGPQQDISTAKLCNPDFAVVNQGIVNCLASNASFLMIEFLDARGWGKIQFTDIFIYESPDVAQTGTAFSGAGIRDVFMLGPCEPSYPDDRGWTNIGGGFFDLSLTVVLPYVAGPVSFQVFHIASTGTAQELEADYKDLITGSYVNFKTGTMSGNDLFFGSTTTDAKVFKWTNTAFGFYKYIGAQSVGIFPVDLCERALNFGFLGPSEDEVVWNGNPATLQYTLPEVDLNGFSHCGHTAAFDSAFKIKDGGDKEPYTGSLIVFDPTTRIVQITNPGGQGNNEEGEYDNDDRYYFTATATDPSAATIEFELRVNWETPSGPDCSITVLTEEQIPSQTQEFDETRQISIEFPDDTVAVGANDPMLCGERTYTITSTTSFPQMPVSVTGTGPNYLLQISSVDQQYVGTHTFDAQVCIDPNQSICYTTQFDITFTAPPDCSTTVLSQMNIRNQQLDYNQIKQQVLRFPDDTVAVGANDSMLCGERTYTFTSQETVFPQMPLSVTGSGPNYVLHVASVDQQYAGTHYFDAQVCLSEPYQSNCYTKTFYVYFTEPQPGNSTPDCSTTVLTQKVIPSLNLQFNEDQQISLEFPDDTVAEGENDPMLCGERTYTITSTTSFPQMPVSVTGTGPNYLLQISSVEHQYVGPHTFDAQVCIGSNQSICYTTQFTVRYTTNNPPDCSTTVLTQTVIPSQSLEFNESKQISLIFPKDSVAEGANDSMFCGERTFTFTSPTHFDTMPVQVTGYGPSYTLHVSGVDQSFVGKHNFDAQVCLSGLYQSICYTIPFYIIYTGNSIPEVPALQNCENSSFLKETLEPIWVEIEYGGYPSFASWTFPEPQDSISHFQDDTTFCGSRSYTVVQLSELLSIQSNHNGSFRVILADDYHTKVSGDKDEQTTVRVFLTDHPSISAEFSLTVHFLPCETPEFFNEQGSLQAEIAPLIFDFRNMTELETEFTSIELPNCMNVQKSYIVRADDLNRTEVDFMYADSDSMNLLVKPKDFYYLMLLGKTQPYIWVIETSLGQVFDIESFSVQYMASSEENAPFFDPALQALVQIQLQLDKGLQWSYELPPISSNELAGPVLTVINDGILNYMGMKFDRETNTLSIEDLSDPEIPTGTFVLPIFLQQWNKTGYNLMTIEILSREEVIVEPEPEVEEPLDEEDIEVEVKAKVEEPATNVDEVQNEVEAWRFKYQKIEREMIRDNSIFEIEPPKPEITFIDQTGEVEISFSQKMSILPDLRVITQGTVLIDKTTLPVLEVYLLKSEFSDERNLAYTWEVSTMTETSVRFSMTFDKARYVSAYSDPEILRVIFRDPYLFVSQTGIPIALKKPVKKRRLQPQYSNENDENDELRPLREGEFITVEREIPPQLQLGGFEETVQQLLKSTADGSKVVVASNFLLNILISASLNMLWSMINTQQLIVMMPLFQIQMPSNASIFFKNIMSIASFDFFDTDEVVHNWFSIMPTGAVEVKYQLIGFESEYWIVNAGSIFLFYIIYLVALLIVYPIVRFCHFRVRKCHKVKSRLRFKVMWSSLITLVNESYMIVVVCILINLAFLSTETAGLTVMATLCVIFMFFSIALPFVLTVHMLCNFERLKYDEVRNKFGQIYTDLDLRQGQKALIYPVFFLARRYALGWSVTKNETLIVQVMLMTAQVIIQAIILGARLLKSRAQERFEFFNESILMLVLYTILCFSPWVSDVEVKTQIGHITIAIVALHLLINIGFIAVMSFMQTKQTCKIKLVKRRHRNQIKKNRAALLAQTGTFKDRIRKWNLVLKSSKDAYEANVQANAEGLSHHATQAQGVVESQTVDDFLRDQALKRQAQSIPSKTENIPLRLKPKNDNNIILTKEETETTESASYTKDGRKALRSNLAWGGKTQEPSDNNDKDTQEKTQKALEKSIKASVATHANLAQNNSIEISQNECKIITGKGLQNSAVGEQQAPHDLDRFRALERETEEILSNNGQVTQMLTPMEDVDVMIKKLQNRNKFNQVDSQLIEAKRPKEETKDDLVLSRRIRLIPENKKELNHVVDLAPKKFQSNDRLTKLRQILEQCQKDEP